MPRPRWDGPQRNLDLLVTGQWRIGLPRVLPGAVRASITRHASHWLVSRHREIDHARPPRGAVLSPNRTYLWVPTAGLVNVVGFGLEEGGCHPYVAGVREMLAGSARSSSLDAYYDHFQPRNLAEIYAGSGTKDLPTLRQAPALSFLAARVFLLRVVPRLSWRLQGRVGGPDQHLGPRYGTNPGMRKALAVYNSIAEHGYDPFAYTQGAVRGYFIEDGDRWRFVVTDGNHRLAAFSLLGLDRVVVEFDRVMPPVVSRSRLQRSAPQRSRVPSCELEHAFDHLLTAQGPVVARSFGIDCPMGDRN